MQNMLMIYFLIFTLIFWAAQSAWLFYFLNMTAEGGAFDILFNWQRLLGKLYNSQYKALQLLEKALGGCEICTSFWMSPFWFAAYYYVLNHIGYWPFQGVFINAIWLFAYWVIGGSISFYIVTKNNQIDQHGL